MENFCRYCGHPLENGRCPNCGSEASSGQPKAATAQPQTPPAQPQMPPPAQPQGLAAGGAEGGQTGGSSSNFIGELRGQLAKRDLSRLIPAGGFALLSLAALLRILMNLAEVYTFSTFGRVISFLEIIAGGAVAFRFVNYLKRPTHRGMDLLGACCCGLLGLMAALNLLGLVINGYAGYSYLFLALLVLMTGLTLEERRAPKRWLYLGAAVALAVLPVLGLVDFSFYSLQQLVYCYAALCGALYCLEDPRA